jgi:hypothetical protein
MRESIQRNEAEERAELDRLLAPKPKKRRRTKRVAKD